MTICFHKIFKIKIKRLAFTVDEFIIGLVILMPLIDMANGFLLRSAGAVVSISQAYKFVLIILMLFRVANISFTSLGFMLMILFFLLQLIFHNIVRHKNINIVTEVVFILKPSFVIIAFYYFRSIIKKHPDFRNTFWKIIKYAFIFFLINQTLGILGFGYPTYFITETTGIGTRGFIYAANELGATFFVIISMYGLRVFSSSNRVKYLLFSILSLILAVSLASKTAIFGISIVLLAIPFFSRKRSILYILFLLPLVFIFLNQIKEAVFSIEAIKRFQYIFEEYGLLQLIFASRYDTLSIVLNDFQHAYSLIDKILGVGQTRLYQDFSGDVEMDPFDMIITYGILGSVIFYGFYFYHFINLLFFLVKKRSYNHFMLLVIFSCLFIISIFAGHVIFSATLAPFLALFLNLIYVKDEFLLG